MTPTDHRGQGGDACQIETIPRMRRVVLDLVAQGSRRPIVHGAVQFEVTALRARIAALRARGFEPPSMTACIAYCVARAVADHPHVHAVRRGRRLFLFESVDLSTVVERHLPDGRAVPISLLLDGANTLSLRTMHERLRAAQTVALNGSSSADPGRARQARLLNALPWVLRVPVWWWVNLFPAFRKRKFGTVNLTAVGMHVGAGTQTWAFPVGCWPLTVTVGTLTRVFVPDDDDAPRLADMLNVTVSADHSAIDGAPIARFVADLRDRIAACDGLDAFEATAQPSRD